MSIKCIKCGVINRRKKISTTENYVCDDCKQHEQVIISLYEQAKEEFSDKSKNLERLDIYEILKNAYFIVQRNPKLSIYSTITKELLEAFATKGLKEIDYDELWRRTKSTRNILKILKSMEDAGIIKIESPDRISRIIKPAPILENFANTYNIHKTKEHARIRVAAVLTMYALLHELYQLAKAKTREDIERQFGPHPPKAPWVATMFLWTKRLSDGEVKKTFTEEEIRKFFAKRGLSSTTISNYISALKATNPHSVQQYVENVQPDEKNGIKFIVRDEIINTLERLYSERVRESDRT